MLPSYLTIDEIKSAHSRVGGYFFDESSMQFFRSRVSRTVIGAGDRGGAFFTTSEQFDRDSPRLYTVRYCSPTGVIYRASDFQQYQTSASAIRAAKRISASDWRAPIER